MKNASLGLLLERLLWPVPRVRWEAARALSRLVRCGEPGVLDALVGWTAKRTLESECLLGLGVVHAFELGGFCPADKARGMVSKPSLVSDRMLRTTYGSREQSVPFKYAVSPRAPAGLDDISLALFDQVNQAAVPPAFLYTLELLEREVDFAFVDRWRHDWAWICRLLGAQPPETGFLLGPGRGRSAALHLPQSEVLVTAYLRTLAYAVNVGKMRSDEAEYHAMVALPMNRGLAELQPIKRPDWSRSLLQRWRDSGRTLIEDIWTQAGKCARPDEIPASLHAVESDERDFIQVKIDLVAGHSGLDGGKPKAKSPIFAWEDAEAECMSGMIRLRNESSAVGNEPMTFACPVAPEHVGRVDASIALQVRLACLGLGLRRGRVQCRSSHVELQVDAEAVSRWCHWYSDWEPSKFAQIDSNVSDMTTVRRSWLQAFVESSGCSLALLARVCVGTREHTHKIHNVEVDEFWISLQEGDTFTMLSLR